MSCAKNNDFYTREVTDQLHIQISLHEPQRGMVDIHASDVKNKGCNCLLVPCASWLCLSQSLLCCLMLNCAKLITGFDRQI